MERQLGSHFITHIGKADLNDVFSNDLIVLYFCAHWAPPCRDLTPLLTNVYRTVNEDRKRFEVICVSFDRDNETFCDYFDDMPWIAVPFGDTERCKDLASQFRVVGVPMVVVLDRESRVRSTQVVTTEGRVDIYDRGPEAIDYWIALSTGATKPGQPISKPEETKVDPSKALPKKTEDKPKVPDAKAADAKAPEVKVDPKAPPTEASRNIVSLEAAPNDPKTKQST